MVAMIGQSSFGVEMIWRDFDGDVLRFHRRLRTKMGRALLLAQDC